MRRSIEVILTREELDKLVINHVRSQFPEETVG